MPGYYPFPTSGGDLPGRPGKSVPYTPPWGPRGKGPWPKSKWNEGDLPWKLPVPDSGGSSALGGLMGNGFGGNSGKPTDVSSMLKEIMSGNGSMSKPSTTGGNGGLAGLFGGGGQSSINDWGITDPYQPGTGGQPPSIGLPFDPNTPPGTWTTGPGGTGTNPNDPGGVTVPPTSPATAFNFWSSIKDILGDNVDQSQFDALQQSFAARNNWRIPKNAQDMLDTAKLMKLLGMDDEASSLAFQAINMGYRAPKWDLNTLFGPLFAQWGLQYGGAGAGAAQ